jgi:aminoglycoside/choline kinase family phosphotransferase
MWLPQRESHQRVGLLDFQDGVYGDGAYDLVSLLEDARRDVPPALASAMLERYIRAVGIDRQNFLTSYAVLGAQRNCKIIGIFSRLAVRDGKFSYLNFLPRVWRHLENDLKHPLMAPLKQWIDRHVPADKRGVITISNDMAKLTA